MRDFEMHDVDIKAFMEALDHCKGDVFLTTDEGDKLNLKSKLSQMMGLMSLIEGGRVLSARITCSDPDDETMLFRMNLFGKGPQE